MSRNLSVVSGWRSDGRHNNWEMGPERRASMGIADSLVRVSVGIEDEADLLTDFTQALDATAVA